MSPKFAWTRSQYTWLYGIQRASHSIFPIVISDRTISGQEEYEVEE